MGSPHRFFDELRTGAGDIAAGAQVRVQKDADDLAAYYVIDFTELELAPAALAMPANGFVSITSSTCGATEAATNAADDDGPAIQRCLDYARSAGLGVWIPAGTFHVKAAPLRVANQIVRGSGMWSSTFSGGYARFYCSNACKFYNFSTFGASTTRVDSSPENAFYGPMGSGTVIENIWVEHHKVGAWIGEAGVGATGLIIRGSRFRNLYADGVNFTYGTINSVVEKSHFRNTGDDAIAAWSRRATNSRPNSGNRFSFNMIQLPWRANCIGVYGGASPEVSDNYCADTVTYPGILISQQFDSYPFSGSIKVLRNTLVRAGGPMFAQQHGAIKIHADQGPIAGVQIDANKILSPTFSGVQFQGPYAINAVVTNTSIMQPGTAAFLATTNAVGAAVLYNYGYMASPNSVVQSNLAPSGRFVFSELSGVSR